MRKPQPGDYIFYDYLGHDYSYARAMLGLVYGRGVHVLVGTETVYPAGAYHADLGGWVPVSRASGLVVGPGHVLFETLAAIHMMIEMGQDPRAGELFLRAASWRTRGSPEHV